jgi:hypothetical protein
LYWLLVLLMGRHATAKQENNLLGVDLVGLGLAAVDGFHVEGASEDS